MAGKGGARPGAGRKPKAEKYARDITRAEKKIRDRLPDIVDAQVKLALGVMVEHIHPLTGVTEVYKEPPDRAAGQYLMDRIMGKPLQKQEIDATVEAIRVEYVNPLTDTE